MAIFWWGIFNDFMLQVNYKLSKYTFIILQFWIGDMTLHGRNSGFLLMLLSEEL
jgi:hypothetical protein